MTGATELLLPSLLAMDGAGGARVETLQNMLTANNEE